jgi:hypothetical protein
MLQPTAAVARDRAALRRKRGIGRWLGAIMRISAQVGTAREDPHPVHQHHDPGARRQ